MDGGVLDKNTVIAFSQFQKSWVLSGLVKENNDLYQSGRQLAAQTVQTDTQVSFVFGCGIKDGGAINGEPLLAGFHDVRPDLVIAGARAGDNGQAKRTFVFTQDGISDRGAAAASLSGTSLTIRNHSNLSWVYMSTNCYLTRRPNFRSWSIATAFGWPGMPTGLCPTDHWRSWPPFTPAKKSVLPSATRSWLPNRRGTPSTPSPPITLRPSLSSPDCAKVLYAEVFKKKSDNPS